ncbi:MAG TPA: hypothetical protein VFJ63_02125 [Candidatus Bathyarchaeia archaeon]|nr:hypothetical protein [Candidatus Bathyarchaeia archaeon]
MTWKNGDEQRTMKRFMTVMLGTFALALSILAVPAVAGAMPPTGSVDSSNRMVFTSGSLTGVFEGNVPHITFYATNDLGRSTYQLNFRALVEFNTTSVSSGEDTYESPQMVARADFDAASWTASSFYPIKDNSGTTIGMGFNLTLNSPMQIVEQNPPVQSLKPGDVVLVAKAYNNTRTMTVNGQSVTINTAEIKIDFVLKAWPFQSTSDKLALEVNMHSDYNHFELDQGTGTSSVDATQGEAASVAEHPYQETSDVEQQVRFSSAPVTSSMNIGFFHFVNTATVTASDGTTTSVPVQASYKAESEKEEGNTNTFLKLYLAYPYFAPGSTLVHDPSFGLQGGLPTLYIVAAGSGIAALAAVLVIRSRHAQVQRYSAQN